MKTKKYSETEIAAQISLNIATLLRGGMSLERALAQLTQRNTDASEIIHRVFQRNAAGVSIPNAFAKEKAACWRVFAVALEIANKTGAPIAHACEKLSDAFLKIDSLQKKRTVLLAGPKSTVILISILPFVSILLGTLMGVDTLTILFSPRGFLLILSGLILLFIGILWAAFMIRRVAETDSVVGIELDLLWVSLAGGQDPRVSLALIATSADKMRSEWIPLNNFTKEKPALKVLETASETGVPVRPLVAAEATALREREHVVMAKKSEELAVRVLLPLGMFILPSFVVLGVIPMVMSLL